MPPRKFPLNASSNFAPALTRYYGAMEHLAQILFRGLAMALKLDDPSWFLKEGRFDCGHQCALRLLNYPELEYVQTDASALHIRAGAHTDYGAMTCSKAVDLDSRCNCPRIKIRCFYYQPGRLDAKVDKRHLEEHVASRSYN